MMTHIYKILRHGEWTSFETSGVFHGSLDDKRDGFIHLSTGEQVLGTLERHFSSADGLGESDLHLLMIDATKLTPGLKWEASRGGALFPHLYGVLHLTHVATVSSLELDGAGRHRLPDDFLKGG